MELTTIEINGVTLYKAQDLLKGYGMDVEKCKKSICNWKVSSGSVPMSVKGKYGGTYLTEDELESLKEYVNPTGKRVYAAKEHGALCAIEQLLNVKLLRQFAIGPHRIDGYDEVNKVAYEIDEAQHFVDGELKQECKDRQSYIEKALGCTFVRIKV